MLTKTVKILISTSILGGTSLIVGNGYLYREEIKDWIDSFDTKKVERKEKLKKEEEEVLLESVWIYWDKGEKKKDCSLQRKTLQESEDTNLIINNSSHPSHSNVSCETLWSQEKDSKKEGFWIRGENRNVKEILSRNWRDLLNAQFVVQKEKVNSDNISDKFNELNKNFCSINMKIKDWVEIECLVY
ncbi:hypothetical protein [Mycoplasma parvum]|uniref:Uncharacterized protein n=1 Tax=Mycoplasma parvum str. Indiana TaxID=1403316 RepID=U5NF39_9MOLU|nr:hypothetical protein [Mycoplasma parvum]AGX88823.1 hypothetical protein PRV_00190 [Mycoplasma parvum str. Indiana]